MGVIEVTPEQQQFLQEIAKSSSGEYVPVSVLIAVVGAFIAAVGSIWALYARSQRKIDRKNKELVDQAQAQVTYQQNLINTMLKDHQIQEDRLAVETRKQLEKTISALQESSQTIKQFGLSNREQTDAIKAMEHNLRTLTQLVDRMLNQSFQSREVR